METFQIKRIILTPDEIKARRLSLKQNSFKSKSVKELSSYTYQSINDNDDDDNDDRYANIAKNLNKSFDFLCQQKTFKKEKVEEIFDRMYLNCHNKIIDPKLSLSMPAKNST